MKEDRDVGTNETRLDRVDLGGDGNVRGALVLTFARQLKLDQAGDMRVPRALARPSSGSPGHYLSDVEYRNDAQ